MERNSLASLSVSSLSVCNLVEKYARLGSQSMDLPDSLTKTLVSHISSDKPPVIISESCLNAIGDRSLILSSPCTPLSSMTILTFGWDAIFEIAISSL